MPLICLPRLLSQRYHLTIGKYRRVVEYSYNLISEKKQFTGFLLQFHCREPLYCVYLLPIVGYSRLCGAVVETSAYPGGRTAVC